MAENGHFLWAENRMDDVMIYDFPPSFKSYVKNEQLLCQRGVFDSGWVFWSGEDDPRERPPPPPPPFSEIIDGTLIALEKIKSHFKDAVGFEWAAQFLIQFWKVIEIGGKRLLTTRHQPFCFNHIHEGLCLYRWISLAYEFDVDGVSDEHLGLPGRVFRHHQPESTPNVQYYSRKEYPQRDHAINCNIKHSLAIPLFEPSRRCCIGVIEMVSTTEIINGNFWIFIYNFKLSFRLLFAMTTSKCARLCDEKYYQEKYETLEEIRKMLEVVCGTHYIPWAQTWASCRLCNAVFKKYNICYIEGHMGKILDACALHHPQKGAGVVGRAVWSQNLVFCKDVTQFSITEYHLAHYAREFGLTGSFAICLRSRYIEDNVYVLEFVLRSNYTGCGDPRIALAPLLKTMKHHCNSLKVASGEELGEELSIEVLDFSKDGKLYSYQIHQTARSPNRMENGEEMVFLDLSHQQLPEVDAVDTGNNVVSKTEENNIVVTSVQQNCIINSSQRLQRKAGIPISLEDLRQHFGMKLDDAAESLGVSRSTVKRACREYNITWWSPRKRSKDNQLLSNKLVQGVVQEQILESSHPPIFDPPHMQDMAIASHTKSHFTAAQDTSIVTIKAKYGDDFIKFQLPVSSGMVEFQQQVAKRLNLQGGTYSVKYQDEDNDWILVVCNEDLQNYICNSISQGRNTVKMSIQPITNSPS